MGAKALGQRQAAGRQEFRQVFDTLCGILRPHADGLIASADSSSELSYTGPMMERWKRELWFGGVKVGRAYVSYHLMPVYMYPDLLRDMSPALKARMQGKSCFNFRHADPAVFRELDELTGASIERLRAEGILTPS